MNKILKVEEGIKIAKKLREQNKSIVLAGGIFDILHVGHIKFIENAKKVGNYLFILLESDEKAMATKGENRPINSQKERAFMLSTIKDIDYIVMLPHMKKDEDYDKLVAQIKPSIVATTYKDPYIIHKQRQARRLGFKVVYVINKIRGSSTTKLAKIIEEKDL